MTVHKLRHRVRLWKTVGVVALIALFYVLLGAILPARHHKQASAAARHFDPAQCYSDSAGPERAACIDDNDEALLWRLRLIRTAEREIALSTFDFRPDEAGLDVMAALYEAAERGVHVRVLVDGINARLYLTASDEMRALAAHPNAEVRFYNTLSLAKPWKGNYRLHDKYVICDDTAFLLGGRNTNALFLGHSGRRQNIDRELLIFETDPAAENTALSQLQSYFARIWDDPDSRPAYRRPDSDGADDLRERAAELPTRWPEAYTDFDLAAATMETNRVTLLSNPPQAVNKQPELWTIAARLMAGADIVRIETPYIICSEQMLSDLRAVADGGTEVRILTNATENGANPFGCADLLGQKANILAAGASIYEFAGDRSRHTKTILIDDRLSLVGSFNLDMRSAYLDTELMLAVDSAALSAHLRGEHEQAAEQCRVSLPDGGTEYGGAYASDGPGGAQLFLYRTLGLLLRPLRHLL